MKHKYEEELEILKERICRDVRESVKHFLESDPEQGMYYEVPLEKQFAEVCEDIADRVSNMADNQNYNNFKEKALSEAFSKIHGSNWKDAFTCEVPEKDFKLYDDACVYHTGAMLQKVSVCDGIVQCFCDGYYHAMDGWT